VLKTVPTPKAIIKNKIGEWTMNQEQTNTIKTDDGSVNDLATKVAHHAEPKIEGFHEKHLGEMINDGQVKRRVADDQKQQAS